MKGLITGILPEILWNLLPYIIHTACLYVVHTLVLVVVNHRREFNPWDRKIPWRRAWQCTPVFLPGESHGPRILVGYSPWGRKESDMIEQLNHRTLGEGSPESTITRWLFCLLYLIKHASLSLSSCFYLFNFFLAMPWDLWDLSSLTKDWTWDVCNERMRS